MAEGWQLQAMRFGAGDWRRRFGAGDLTQAIWRRRFGAGDLAQQGGRGVAAQRLDSNRTATDETIGKEYGQAMP